MELYERTTRTTADRLIAREVRPSSLGAPNSNTDDDIVWHARAITDLTGWAVVFTRIQIHASSGAAELLQEVRILHEMAVTDEFVEDVAPCIVTPPSHLIRPFKQRGQRRAIGFQVGRIVEKYSRVRRYLVNDATDP